MSPNGARLFFSGFFSFFLSSFFSFPPSSFFWNVFHFYFFFRKCNADALFAMSLGYVSRSFRWILFPRLASLSIFSQHHPSISSNREINAMNGSRIKTEWSHRKLCNSLILDVKTIAIAETSVGRCLLSFYSSVIKEYPPADRRRSFSPVANKKPKIHWFYYLPIVEWIPANRYGYGFKSSWKTNSHAHDRVFDGKTFETIPKTASDSVGSWLECGTWANREWHSLQYALTRWRARDWLHDLLEICLSSICPCQVGWGVLHIGGNWSGSETD